MLKIRVGQVFAAGTWRWHRNRDAREQQTVTRTIHSLILSLTGSQPEHGLFPFQKEKVSSNEHSLTELAFGLHSREVCMSKTDKITALKMLYFSQTDRKSTNNEARKISENKSKPKS